MMEEEYCEMGRSYYAILGVSADSSVDEIRRAYRKLAMRWHPDKWTRNPSLLGEAKRKFQQIQEAYSVLSDPRKKTMYDAGLYDPDEEEDEGFADFLQEMLSHMDNVRKEESSSGNSTSDSIQGTLEACQNVNKVYTMEELQSMFWEMAQGFETTDWSIPPNQSMYSSPHWLQESFTLQSPATSSRVPWPEGGKCFGASAKAPCSSVGSPWGQILPTFW